MIDQGTYASITPDQIISSAKAQLKIENTDSEIWFEKMVNEGVRHIDALSLFKKQVTTLPVRDKMATLPCGFFRMIAMALGGNGADCAAAIYVDLPFIQSCGCSPVLNSNGVFSTLGLYEIQDNKIYFHSDMIVTTTDVNGNLTTTSTVDITEVTIAYFGLNIDDDGLLKVYQDMERALTAYLCWKYTLQNFKEYPQYVQNEYKMEWIAQKKWVKSIQFQNDFRNTRRQIAEIVNAVVVDKQFNP